jgi:hypothetical protein
MKEIQEEEERRKKMAIKETTAAAAARRGYADTTNKVSASAKILTAQISQLSSRVPRPFNQAVARGRLLVPQASPLQYWGLYGLQ